MNIKNNIKSVAFPREQGSWGFMLEPLILALLIAFTTNGFLIALSAFIIFLSHQPVRIIANKKSNKELKLTASIIFIIYSSIAAILIFTAFLNMKLILFLPYFTALLLMTIYLLLELKGYGRLLAAELIAPVAVSLIAVSITFADGWPLYFIIPFWIILLSRSIQTTFYVNAMVKIIKNQSASPLLTYTSGFIFLLIVTLNAFQHLSPFLAIAAVIILIIRSFVGFTSTNKKVNIKKIGIMEFVYGIVFIILVAIGYNLGL